MSFLNQIRRLTCVGLVTLTVPAAGQEVLFTPSATAPGKGIFGTRQIVSFESFDAGNAPTPFDVDQTTLTNLLAYGITPDLTASIKLPAVYRDFDAPPGVAGDNFGVKDIELMLKYRFYQEDLGTIDTLRMSLVGGIEIPSYDDAFSSDSFDPFIGWAMTYINGRHGIGAYTSYKWNTGGDPYQIDFGDGQSDAIRLDGSYLYRIDPVQYTAETTRSTYLVVEVNHRHETNGDDETLLSPGLLIEAQRWAAEIAVRVPIAQSLDHRAEMDWAISVGFRYTF